MLPSDRKHVVGLTVEGTGMGSRIPQHVYNPGCSHPGSSSPPSLFPLPSPTVFYPSPLLFSNTRSKFIALHLIIMTCTNQFRSFVMPVLTRQNDTLQKPSKPSESLQSIPEAPTSSAVSSFHPHQGEYFQHVSDIVSITFYSTTYRAISNCSQYTCATPATNTVLMILSRKRSLRPLWSL